MTQFHATYGPPGCGKTTNLAKHARNAASESRPENVVIASFTNAAASAIAARDTGVPSDNVGTLHALARRQGGREEIAETNPDDWNENFPNWSITKQNRGKADVPRSRFGVSVWDVTGDDLLNECSRLRGLMVPYDDWSTASPLGDVVPDFYRQWTDWKNDLGFIDFTDMIETAVDSHTMPPSFARVLLFDEAQDYTRLEFKLCCQWGEHADHVRFVGDPDQTLYQFRGADPLLFEDSRFDSRKTTLQQSYRVPKAVRDYATRWIERLEDRARVTYLPTDTAGEVNHIDTWYAHPNGNLFELIDKCEANDESLMMLSSFGHMLTPLVSEFRRRGIAYHNPYVDRWSPLSPGSPKNRTALYRLTKFMSVSIETDPASIFDWVELLDSKILSRGAKTRAKNMEVGLELGALRDLFLNEADFHKAMDADLDWLFDNMLDSWRTRMSYPVAVMKRYGGNVSGHRARKVRESVPKVIIGTHHSVKGGEADNVLIYPDISKAAQIERLEDPGPLTRQFYVAMTRARNRLFLAKPYRGRGGYSVNWM